MRITARIKKRVIDMDTVKRKPYIVWLTADGKRSVSVFTGTFAACEDYAASLKDVQILR